MKRSAYSFILIFSDPFIDGNVIIYIVINISDNGIGIPDIKKAMNPYFTTKPQGTGLGLPIINKIINEHSGELVITNNEKMDGVEIKILLPRN